MSLSEIPVVIAFVVGLCCGLLWSALQELLTGRLIDNAPEDDTPPTDCGWPERD